MNTMSDHVLRTLARLLQDIATACTTAATTIREAVSHPEQPTELRATQVRQNTVYVSAQVPPAAQFRAAPSNDLRPAAAAAPPAASPTSVRRRPREQAETARNTRPNRVPPCFDSRSNIEGEENTTVVTADGHVHTLAKADNACDCLHAVLDDAPAHGQRQFHCCFYCGNETGDHDEHYTDIPANVHSAWNGSRSTGWCYLRRLRIDTFLRHQQTPRSTSRVSTTPEQVAAIDPRSVSTILQRMQHGVSIATEQHTQQMATAYIQGLASTAAPTRRGRRTQVCMLLHIMPN